GGAVVSRPSCKVPGHNRFRVLDHRATREAAVGVVVPLLSRYRTPLGTRTRSVPVRATATRECHALYAGCQAVALRHFRPLRQRRWTIVAPGCAATRGLPGGNSAFQPRPGLNKGSFSPGEFACLVQPQLG